VVEEAPASAGTQGSQEIAAGASSNVASKPGEGTGTPMPEEKTGEAANLTCTGADASPGDASQGSPTARAEEIGRVKATVAPEATAKDTREGKPLRLRPAAALVGRVLLASSRRNGLIWHLALAPVRLEPKP
jgi:hypothetical protein